jgi:A/G-specific adenine glycosylase
MLQQTQVVTVIPYFEQFIDRFPTLESLAQASEEAVLQRWAGLGYYSRARHLLKGAKQIAAQGRFPQTREEWLKIPGVGNYTAGAILSIAGHQPEAILDGNVERVLSRLRRVSRSRGDSAFRARLWRLSAFLVKTAAQKKKIDPSVFNQALMELGATVCTPKKPLCLLCPLRDGCRAHHFSEEEHYPPRKKPKEWLQIRETLHCVLDHTDQVLLQKRLPGEWRAGLWDFLEQAPMKTHVVYLGEVVSRHVVTRHKIHRKTQLWKLKKSRTLTAAEGDLQRYRWVSRRIPEVPVGSPLKKVLRVVQDRLAES